MLTAPMCTESAKALGRSPASLPSFRRVALHMRTLGAKARAFLLRCLTQRAYRQRTLRPRRCRDSVARPRSMRESGL